MSRRREKRRAWDKKGSNRSWCRASPGDEMFSEGQIFMAVPTMKPIYPAGTRAADTPPQWLLQSVTLQQYWFGLTVLKLALYSHQEPKYWLSSPVWQNTLPSSMQTKAFAPTLCAGYSETPPYSLILKTQASSEEKRFSKGHHQKLWFLVIKGFRRDIS